MFRNCSTCGAGYDDMPGRLPHACPPPDPAAPKPNEQVIAAGRPGYVRLIRPAWGAIPTLLEVYHPSTFRTNSYTLDQIERVAAVRDAG